MQANNLFLRRGRVKPRQQPTSIRRQELRRNPSGRLTSWEGRGEARARRLTKDTMLIRPPSGRGVYGGRRRGLVPNGTQLKPETGRAPLRRKLEKTSHRSTGVIGRREEADAPSVVLQVDDAHHRPDGKSNRAHPAVSLRFDVNIAKKKGNVARARG